MFTSFCWMGVFLSLLMGASSSGPLMFWVAMELNLLSFIGCLMVQSKSSRQLVKYFLVQAVSSGLFFTGTVLMSLSLVIGVWLAGAALAGKAGAAPLHGWVVQMVAECEGASLYGLLSVQKILPIMAFSYFSDGQVVSFLFVSCLIVGVAGSLAQTSANKLVGYSSVFGLSWVFLNLQSLWEALIYFSAYSFSLIMVMASILPNKAQQLYSGGSLLAATSGSFGGAVGLMSLAGVPPTLGFVGKVLVICASLEKGLFLESVLLLLASIMMLLLYLSWAMMFLTASPVPWSRESPPVSTVVAMVATVSPVCMLLVLRLSASFELANG